MQDTLSLGERVVCLRIYDFLTQLCGWDGFWKIGGMVGKILSIDSLGISQSFCGYGHVRLLMENMCKMQA